MCLALSAEAQLPDTTAEKLGRVATTAASLGATYGERIWPGFRPDTIPVAFVLPERGMLLTGWRGALPNGFVPVPGRANAGWREERALGAASTGTEISGRRVAQVVVSSLDATALVPLVFHEAFHVFQAASRRLGKSFGAGENSALVSSYPVFDVDNETLFALEGRILAAAMNAGSTSRKRELSRQFVGVRRARHRALPSDMASFDQASELNEGLAEYALVRALVLMRSSEGANSEVSRRLNERQRALENLTGNTNLSLRLRFYQTGPAIALLLDDLAGPRWKARLVADNMSLQDMLASVTGVDAVADSARARAERTFDLARARADAKQGIVRLQAQRRAQVDTVLSKPGIRLIVLSDSLPTRNFNFCGFDPQNTLQVTPTVQLQTRWWRPCSGGPTYAEFNVPSVYDSAAGTLSAVIGEESAVTLTSDGQTVTLRDGGRLSNLTKFKLTAPRATVDAVRADVWREGKTIFVRAKTP
jgi:hypothetical protein